VGVDGAVNRPGWYELIGSRDLAELVELAGGLSPSLTTRLPISLVRRGPEDKEDQLLLRFGEHGELPAMALQHQDAVRVPAMADLQRSVVLIGALAGVASPDEAQATKRLPFVQGDTVRTLLDRVGGVGPTADLEGAYLLRGGTSLPLDLTSLVMLRDLRADRPVELGDTLVVPFKRRSIMVEGSVFRPGPYPYNPNYRIGQYLSLAGGTNRNAQPITAVRVISPNGETREYDPELKIEPGSSLVVPERTFSRAEVVQIIISAGVALAITAKKL
jgi:protein involved in polysaccharide export with SLBB domain